MDLLFNLSDADSKVLHNGKLRSLSAIINAQREEDPADAKIAYHDLVDDPKEGVLDTSACSSSTTCTCR